MFTARPFIPYTKQTPSTVFTRAFSCLLFIQVFYTVTCHRQKIISHQHKELQGWLSSMCEPTTPSQDKNKKVKDPKDVKQRGIERKRPQQSHIQMHVHTQCSQTGRNTETQLVGLNRNKCEAMHRGYRTLTDCVAWWCVCLCFHTSPGDLCFNS